MISAFNRNVQLASTLDSIIRQIPSLPYSLEVIVVDDGDASHGHPPARFLCEQFSGAGVPLRYIPCRRPASSQFRNPSFPNNVGIRAAQGDVIILQNAECRHDDPDVIQKLVSSVTPTRVVFAHVRALDQTGAFVQDYCSPSNPRPYFFCGAVQRDLLIRLRGFDEDFHGAGYDDDDLALRLHCEGAEFIYSDAKVSHQWHEQAGDYSSADQMRELFERKCGEMARGELGTVRNEGRAWGGQP